jgi:hypothetical protein
VLLGRVDIIVARIIKGIVPFTAKPVVTKKGKKHIKILIVLLAVPLAVVIGVVLFFAAYKNKE